VQLNPLVASHPAPVLRYPGSKRLSINLLRPYLAWLAEGRTSVVDAFIGSGAITVWLAQQSPDRHIFAADKDEFVAAFWQIVSSTAGDAQRLCAALDVSPSLAYFDWMKERMVAPERLDTLEKAAFAIQSSRFTFSGIQLGGPFGGRHQTGAMKIGSRYNVETLCQGVMALHGLLSGRFSAERADAVEFIGQHGDIPGYFDPPYVGKGGLLYRVNMSPEEHATFATVLRDRDRWLVTYDNHPLVRSLYDWAQIDEFPVRYGGCRGKNDRWREEFELVITPAQTPGWELNPHQTASVEPENPVIRSVVKPASA